MSGLRNPRPKSSLYSAVGFNAELLTETLDGQTLDQLKEKAERGSKRLH